jgi:starch synthase
MTGLIPTMARRIGIPCLYTIHNIHTVKTSLSQMEDRGIDAADFWQQLFFERVPASYEESRDNNLVDFLVSGVFAAHFVNVVSPTFLQEIVEGRHGFVSASLRREMISKWDNDCAIGILNAPDPAYNPRNDEHLTTTYGSEDHRRGKRGNKLALQHMLGLIEEETAPLLFWPSRLDPIQKGCQLLADIFYGLISTYWDQNLEVVFVADGDYQNIFKDIVARHGFEKRVAICDFSEQLEHMAYAASDFILMPSLFEPCGLPQMIAPLYGSLPVAHDTGGIHDTLSDLNVNAGTGNGFIFKTYDAHGLWWAIEQAMKFYQQPVRLKEKQITRIMTESAVTFTHEETAKSYINLYEKMLQRPLINS